MDEIVSNHQDGKIHKDSPQVVYNPETLDRKRENIGIER